MKNTYSLDQIALVAADVIEEAFIDYQVQGKRGAAIVGLVGDLGAGKTTLVKEIAARFGVKDQVTSPTFVIAKWYDMEDSGHHFKKLIHIDAYRIQDEAELIAIDFDQICKEDGALVIVEWPENIKDSMIRVNGIKFNITHDGQERHIEGPYKYE